jgi:hypothetical protein
MNKTLASLSFVAFALVTSDGLPAEDAFRDRIVPFVKEYCVECHNQETSEGELNLTQYTSVEMLGEHYRQWEHVISFMKKGEMPPADAKQPSAELRTGIMATIGQLLKEEARKLAGDPGVVLPRRLTNSEYNYTIRDLTGVDIQPARSFPVDPASGEGFNNTGEALIMSPSLFKKYYAGAQEVADHVLLTPSGLRFAPYSVITYADQKKFYENAIISFYEQHNVDYKKYLTAAWAYHHRIAEQRSLTIEQWAEQQGLSPRYLGRLQATLNSDSDERFYIGWLKSRWVAVSALDNASAAANGIRSLAADIQRLSKAMCRQETNAIVSNAGNPPIFHTDRRNKTAAERDKFNEGLIADSQQLHVEFHNLDKRPTISLFLCVADPTGDVDGSVTLSDLNFSTESVGRYKPNNEEHNTRLQDLLKQHAPDQAKLLNFGKRPDGTEIDAGSVVLKSPVLLKIELPANAFGDEKRIHFHARATLDRDHSPYGTVRVAVFDHEPSESELARPKFPLVNPTHAVAEELRASGETFCSLFPNRFLYVDGTRGLSAGFHLIEGFFRDDQPLCKLVLSDQQNEELNRLWVELRFGTGIAEKLLRGFVFFERSERNFMKHADFDSIKEEDPKLVEDETLSRFRDIYLARSNVKATGEELTNHPIHVFFETIRRGLKQQTTTLVHAEPVYLRQLEDLAARAYRRPLTDTELETLRAFFHDVSQQPEYGVEQAVRATIVSLLVSPHFTYRLDPPPAGDSVRPIPDVTLASRLSYFLWSSMPDAELLALAESGKLLNTDALRDQTRRMLKDPKVSAFALEFFGQWLGHRDFLSQESVNREVFRDFDDKLKQAMFEEPTRLITNLIQQDRPVTDLLSSDTTFVNERLAKHYGLPFDRQNTTGRNASVQFDEWVSVDGMRQRGRGGLLGMAVFLTKFSQPERTSPVKRGFWVFHKVLGQHIPAPPADVAVLPAKETDTNGKTIRELLKLHTDDAKCARCHVRFDPIGLSMEGFDPIGRTRNKDLAGRAVDNAVQLPNGKEVRGVPEFAEYLATHRRDEFIRTLCRKFLGYALGRSLVLSDQPLLEAMETALEENDYRFSSLFETVVLSSQFRNERCRDFTTARFRATVDASSATSPQTN